MHSGETARHELRRDPYAGRFRAGSIASCNGLHYMPCSGGTRQSYWSHLALHLFYSLSFSFVSPQNPCLVCGWNRCQLRAFPTRDFLRWGVSALPLQPTLRYTFFARPQSVGSLGLACAGRPRPTSPTLFV